MVEKFGEASLSCFQTSCSVCKFQGARIWSSPSQMKPCSVSIWQVRTI